MIRSMTGFGRGEIQNELGHFLVEVRSVNHRYLDVSFRMPKRLMVIENDLKNLIKKKISRGHLDVYLRWDPSENYSDKVIVADKGLAKQYFHTLQEISSDLGYLGDFSFDLIAKFPDVIRVEEGEQDFQAIISSIGEALGPALENITTMREAEGALLQNDIEGRLRAIESDVEKIRSLSPRVVENYRERLRKRIAEIAGGANVDPGRLEMEVAIFAERCDITEEVVRILAHIQHFRESLTQGAEGGVGKKLEFIVQEMNREINTIGAKASDSEISLLVVKIKSELERVREQVQNVE
ncbi:MAG: YicC/YloC family endoribonuclease [bacterium]